MTIKPKAFGKDWTQGAVSFPKHLTPEVIHSALFIHNADSKEETARRVEHCAKLIGDELMSYAMSLLVALCTNRAIYIISGVRCLGGNHFIA